MVFDDFKFIDINEIFEEMSWESLNFELDERKVENELRVGLYSFGYLCDELKSARIEKKKGEYEEVKYNVKNSIPHIRASKEAYAIVEFIDQKNGKLFADDVHRLSWNGTTTYTVKPIGIMYK